jgi:methylphosphotriester-DNA--protein-cysteine methyltransferase
MIIHHHHSQKEIRNFIRKGAITYAGNAPDKIYGTLSCWSGKKMKIENRVFFENQSEALDAGFRPCGHCLHDRYAKWRNETKDKPNLSP